MGNGKKWRESDHKNKREEKTYREKRTLAALDELTSPTPSSVTVPAPVYTPKTREKETAPQRSEGKVIRTVTVQGNGKIFYIDTIQNERGLALQVTEISKGQRTAIVVPVELAHRFTEAVEDSVSKLPA